MMGNFLSGLVSGFMTMGGSQAAATGAGGVASADAAAAGKAGDIVRENPYGTTTDVKPINSAGTTNDVKPGLTDDQKKGLNMIQKGAAEFGTPHNSSTSPGNAYNALFSPDRGAFQTPSVGGGHIGQQAVTPPPTLAPPAPIQIPQQQFNPQMPAPMPMPAMPSQQPVPMALGVSDMRAKQNIRHANADMDKFLQKVYNNLISKGKI